jgi:hypothetical protein
MNKDKVLFLNYSKVNDVLSITEHVVPAEFNELLHSLEEVISSHSDYVEAVRELNRDIYKPLYDITKNYSYCKNLNGAYQNFQLTVQDYSIKAAETALKSNAGEDVKDFSEEGNKLIKKLIDHLKHTVIAYNLEKVYHEAEISSDIVAYSHRRRGWSFPMRKINENFKFRFKTNFGYGRKAYFYLQVIFEGFKIVKYSDVITYKSKPLFEISEYSATYRVLSSEWISIINTVVEMHGCAQDKGRFVKKYIIDECKLMIEKLSELLENDNFKFVDYVHINVNKEDVTHHINEIRAVKIIAVLHMFNVSIIKCPYVEGDQVLNEIISMANQLLPILENEIPLIQTKISKIKVQIEINRNKLKNEYSAGKAIKQELSTFIEQYRQIDRQNSKLKIVTVNTLNAQFFEGRENDKHIYTKYLETERVINTLSARLLSLRKVFKSIVSSQKKIIAMI